MTCKYRKKGTTDWNGDFEHQPTYHKEKEYAECSAWLMGALNFDIKLELNGKSYLTDEETAISRGIYPTKGNLY